MQALSNGVLAASCIQCATAVAVPVSNFATTGGVGILECMAILLGTDIGSAIVSQILWVRQNLLNALLLLVSMLGAGSQREFDRRWR